MPGLVIKDLPAELHRKLKQQAANHHRSMTKEVLFMLERALSEETSTREPTPPFKGRFALTNEFIERSRREGRE